MKTSSRFLAQLVSYLFTAYSAQLCIILDSRTTDYATPTNVADNPQLERCNQQLTYATLALISSAVRSMCTMTQPVISSATTTIQFLAPGTELISSQYRAPGQKWPKTYIHQKSCNIRQLTRHKEEQCRVLSVVIQYGIWETVFTETFKHQSLHI